ncbi:MAG: pyruvate, phosphate dikinase [Maritimibacter sp.]
MNRRLYPFDHAHTGVAEDVIRMLGGKGYSLWLMSSELGLPVPPGFTITTQTAEEFATSGLTEALKNDVRAAMADLEARMGRRFGDPVDPLLVSVRSGAAQSMPGMMDTLLNVGMTRQNAQALADQTGDAAFAWGSYRRFLVSFATLVLGRDIKTDHPSLLADPDAESACDALIQLIDDPRLDDPYDQMFAAVETVFASWQSPRAISYRRKVGLSDAGGTAVNIQAMVFGNLDDQSGTGVAFTRDPSTGAAQRCGDFLFRAQGDDVVSGDSLTQFLSDFEAKMPDCYAQLESAMARLETHYRDMCDIEFTVERGRLWMLQARVGKRSPAAAPRIAVEMCSEGVLSQEEAVARIDPELLYTGGGTHRASGEGAAIGKGLAVSPGVATGEIAFDPDTALDWAEDGRDVILVRRETSPEDVHGMGVAKGILTTLGGMMSHAAVVARAWGIPAVCAMENVTLDDTGLSCGGHVYREGDVLSLDGTSGLVFSGAIEAEHDVDPYLDTLRAWAANRDQNTLGRK